jgi:hypothetical protein
VVQKTERNEQGRSGKRTKDLENQLSAQARLIAKWICAFSNDISDIVANMGIYFMVMLLINPKYIEAINSICN